MVAFSKVVLMKNTNVTSNTAKRHMKKGVATRANSTADEPERLRAKRDKTLWLALGRLTCGLQASRGLAPKALAPVPAPVLAEGQGGVGVTADIGALSDWTAILVQKRLQSA